MNKKIFLLLPFLLSSCNQNNTSDNNNNSNNNSNDSTVTNVTIIDIMNREVSYNPSEVKKIVCIGAGALRLYSYVGNLDMLYGCEDIDRSIEDANPFKDASRPYFDANVDKFKTLPSCGKGGPQNQSPEFEKILSCNPDLIISEYTNLDVVKQIEEKTKKLVVCVSYGNNSVFDDNVKTSLNIIGTICNTNDRSQKLNEYIKECENELKDIANKYTINDKYYIGCLGNWGAQSYLSTSPNYPLFNINNLKNAINTTFNISNGKITADNLVSANPDRIIFDAAGIDLLKDEYKDSTTNTKPTLEKLNAVKNNEVYLQMPFNAYYTNLEIALMDAYYLSYISYPEAYSNFSIKSKSDEITKKFLNKEMYESIISKKTSNGGFKKIDNLDTFLNS